MSEPLGAIVAGGGSTRYGSPKALAAIGGVRLIDRVLAVLSGITPDVVLIANDPTLAAAVPLRWRRDVMPGAGALGGIHAALLWAADERRPGILAVACDMPFLSAALLDRIVRSALHGGEDAGPPDVVVPESGGRRGVEPLCAYYSVRCIAALETALAEGDRRMIGFHDRVRVQRIPLEEVARLGAPDVLFLNVNTPEERERAERIERERRGETERP